MADEKKSSSKKRKETDESAEKDYKGIVRVTEKVQTNYTVMNKKRAEEPSSNGEDKSNFQRTYTIMSPKRKKESRHPSIGSKYV